MTYQPERQEEWTYHDYVRAWQEIDSRSAWLKGDLAAAVETQYGEQSLQRYADDVGCAYETLRQYRWVAAAYPQNGRRLQVSWGAHQALAAQPDRLELLQREQPWTVAEARELVSSRRQLANGSQVPSPALPVPVPASSSSAQTYPASAYPQQPVAQSAYPPPGSVVNPFPQPSAPVPPAPQTAPRPAPVMLTLRTHDGQEVPYQQPQSRATFNETAGEGISWAGWSWNPVTGCLHGCRYCYARAIASRWADTYPAGFTPLFHHERLDAPANTRIPAAHQDDPAYRRVFVCSMADLYGRWVPDEWIKQVHDSMLASPQWEYLLLTKFPSRYVGLDLPGSTWLGTSVDEQKRVRIAEDAFRQVSGVKVKWLSLEPLREPLEFTDLTMFDWVVIGAQTETYQPDGLVPAFRPPDDWVIRLTHQAREAGCKVHWKPNLGRVWYDEYPV